MYSIHIEQRDHIVSFITGDLELVKTIAESLDRMRPYVNTWIIIENHETNERETIHIPVNPRP